MVTPTKFLLGAALALSLAGCDHSHEHAAPMAAEEAAAPTNRVDVPASVRQNLGITFVTVERRAVAATRRHPGVFELKSSARHVYTVPAAGRVLPVVGDYEEVAAGATLFRVESPEWAALKARLEGALVRATTMRRQIEAHALHRQALEELVHYWRERLAQLERLRESGAAQWGEISHAQQNIADTEAAIADAEEKHHALLREAVPLLAEGGANAEFDLALQEAATLLGVTTAELLAEVDGAPRWRTIAALEVVAAAPGRVEPMAVAPGALLAAGTTVMTVTDLAQQRFRAKALQSDLARLRPGAAVRIVPPGIAPGEALAGTLALGLEADPRQRTIDLVIDVAAPQETLWARPGVAAVAEVVVAGGAAPELAVPVGALITDGLQRVLFRRDPDNPDQVIRLEADAGVSDGQWVEILSGLREGDEVVLGGVYELMLGSSTGGARQQGGHFHADGTYHEAH